jgi:hypothetical protein
VPQGAVPLCRCARNAPLLGLLLACALVLAQTLLAAHGVEHLGHGDEAACEVCVVGASLGAGLGTALPSVPMCSKPLSPQPVALLRPWPRLRATFNPHSARAPPHHT